MLTCGVGIGNQPALIVAALDLQLVRLLRAAMAKGNFKQSLLGPRDRLAFGSRLRAEPTLRFEPRKRLEPEPRIEPRKVIHLEPRYQPPPPQAPLEPEQPVRTKSPIEPPWRVLPWHELPLQPPQVVKLNIIRPDVIHKGTLIDLFI